ncbi:MAG TPA: phosphatidylglycerophosphatase A [Sulfurimonas sp.]|nr:phosphatidylglycerophosphatase A [Sulfurimonas sp.]
MNWFLLTVGYSGTSKIAPGTVGSAVSLLLGLVILVYFDSTTLFLASLLASVAGYKLVNDYEAKGGIHDNKHIVIDELAGMWITMSIACAAFMDESQGSFSIPMQAFTDYMSHWSLWLAMALSFAAFRYFDIAKPSIIGRIDKNTKGGLGVMGDDVVAGVAAGILTAFIMKILFMYLGSD